MPKGNIAAGDEPWQSAAQEAWEEAGVRGVIEREPLGEYEFRKAGRLQRVQVFLLCVTQTARTWPEQEFRRRIWMSVEAAVTRITHRPLREFLAELSAKSRRSIFRAA